MKAVVRHGKFWERMSALGQKQTLRGLNGMSALPPKADIGGVSSDVRFVPKADIVKLYSITSSARTSNEGGMLSPRAFAVFKFISKSNLDVK
jgi:hypothetical protein